METAMRNVSINDRATSLSPMIKAEPLPQDQPLDFSKRVRHSLEDESLRKVSEDSAVCDLQHTDRAPSSQPATRTNLQPSTELEFSPDTSNRHLISEPPPRASMPSISSLLPQTTLAAPAMGMFYPGAPVFPNFMPPGFPPMWPNPMAAAAMIQQQQEAARKLLQNGHKPSIPSPATQRGFNSTRLPYLNKDPLAVLGGVRPGFPSMPPVTAAMLSTTNSPMVGGSTVPDPGLLAEALKSHEEMFNAYKQQVGALQVLNQKANDDLKRGGHRRQAAASTTITNGSHPIPSATQMPSSTMETVSETETTINPDDVSEDNSNPATSQPMLTSNNDTQKLEDSAMNGDDLSTDLPVQTDECSAAVAAAAVAAAAAQTQSQPHSLHSSDESIPSTSDSRRSLTPAHSSCSEFLDSNGMRPRSSTLPTQSDCRHLTYSPAPSNMSNGNQSSGPATPNSKGSFRKRARTLPDDQKDDAYWERRRKNNEAAKRSRDSRRAKEDEIAIRAAFLEQENLRLRVELAALRQQTAKLRSELIIIQGPADAEHTTPAEGS